MNKKGIYLTIEAIISLILIISIILMQTSNEKTNLDELYQVQKQSDLIRAWITTQNFKETEIIKDTKSMFPEKKTRIRIEEKNIEINQKKPFKKETTIKGFYWKNNELKEITLTIFN